MPVPIIAAGVAAAGGVYAASQRRKSQKEQIALAEKQSGIQQQIAREAREAARMTPEERAFRSMLFKRSTAEMEAPEIPELTTEATLDEPLKALQRQFMARGFQPSPETTGLLIAPSQEIARRAAVENALLRLEERNRRWSRAIALSPERQRAIEQGAPLQTMPTEAGAAGLPYQAAADVARTRAGEASTAQFALGNLLSAYSSPLLQQRISGRAGTNILPENAKVDFRENVRLRR